MNCLSVFICDLVNVSVKRFIRKGVPSEHRPLVGTLCEDSVYNAKYKLYSVGVLGEHKLLVLPYATSNSSRKCEDSSQGQKSKVKCQPNLISF